MTEKVNILNPDVWRRWWSLWATAGVDHDAVLTQIGEESGWSGRYAFLVVVSAAISLLGLLMPSVAVLIGAMLLSPLMMPIIALGFGIATLDFHAIKRSAAALAAGSALAIGLSVLMVTLSPVQTITSEIASRTQPTLFDLLVALLSALAGAYALIRGRGGAVVGVAIAIALMPPLAVVGFGIATWNWTVFAGSLLLFMTNAITIALTAALVARAYGFGSHLAPRHTGWQLALFVVALGLLSVPLGAGLKEIAFEALAQRQVRDTIRERFPAEARLGQVDIDFAVTPIRVRAVMLTPRLDPDADKALARRLQARLARPIDIHVDQLRTSMDAGATEAAQLARAIDRASARDDDARDRAIDAVALVSGADPGAIIADEAARTLTVRAVPLPDLTMTGYRSLEQRAARAASGWTVRLVPPGDLALPTVTFDAGVVDAGALDLAAWGSDRSGRALLVRGGSAAQRRAVVEGLRARGAAAEPDPGGGALTLAWKLDDAPANPPE